MCFYSSNKNIVSLVQLYTKICFATSNSNCGLNYHLKTSNTARPGLDPNYSWTQTNPYANSQNYVRDTHCFGMKWWPLVNQLEFTTAATEGNKIAFVLTITGNIIENSNHCRLTFSAIYVMSWRHPESAAPTKQQIWHSTCKINTLVTNFRNYNVTTPLRTTAVCRFNLASICLLTSATFATEIMCVTICKCYHY